MNLLSERLKLAMKLKFERDFEEVRPADIARACKTSDASVNYWLNDANGISAKKSRLLADFLGVDPIWLETGRGDPTATGIIKNYKNNSEQDHTNDVVITQYKEVRGSMGGGLILQDQPGEIESMLVNEEWIRKNVRHCTSTKNLCVVTGFGDSMKGMYNPGDPLLVDIGVRTLEFDGVYFFRINNEGFIKTLQRIPGVGIRVISENKKYEAWTITQDMDFEILARVIKVWESTDF